MNTNLAGIDLNLLVALRMLLEERSVTRAAERLFVTQPAMSKTLQRLRELFGDELFTRSAHGLVPTPRALELEPTLQQALEFLETELFGSQFDPAQAQAELSISVPEMLGLVAIPALTAHLAEHAPGVRVQSRNLLDDYLELMAVGALDFAIYVQPAPSDDYVTHTLMTSTAHIWLPADHPLTEKDVLRLEDLSGMPSVTIYLPGLSDSEISNIQSGFAEHGVELRGLIQTTQLMIAMEVITRQGAFMLGPQHLEHSVLAQGKVVSRPLDYGALETQIQLELVLIQHRRTLNSALHCWLRDLIIQTYAQLQEV